MAIAFDTLKFTDRLVASGVPQEQARAQALQEAWQSADIATKHDLHELRHHMDLKFTEVDAKFSEVEAKIESVKTDILKWVTGLLLAQAAVIAALVKLLS
ncbi:MAG: DUF1640 domain-containing protein [Gammaproteobacteria bacterium]|nr:DUF1640 domain-containing protein [Gammaproteobacteria bacterium]